MFAKRADGKMSIAFFDASARSVCDELCSWGRDTGYVYELSDLADARNRWEEFLTPYVTPPNAGIVMPTSTPWTGFIENDKIGGIPFGTLFSLSERLRTRAVGLLLGDLRRGKSPAGPYSLMFYHADGSKGEATTRSVAVIYDRGRWEYDEQGSPLSFENTGAYRSPRKAERLTPEMLERYAIALGLQLNESEHFYRYGGAIGLKWYLKERLSTSEASRILIDTFTKAQRGQ